MASYDIYVFDGADISTNGADFTQPDGQQYTFGTSTITINMGADDQRVSVEDPDDQYFDDDDPNPQTINGDYTINGNTYTDGSIIEAEYLMQVQDSAGNNYYIAAVSFNGDPYSIDGFTIHGPLPPFGEPLTVVGAWEGALNAVPYTSSSSTPACFEARTRIDVPGGWKEARELRAGDPVMLADGSVAELAHVLHRNWTIGGKREDRPVRIQGDALGAGSPGRRLVVSPQHRIWLPQLEALVPARALVVLPRIGLLQDVDQIDYVHLVLPQHSLLRAENTVCESFWPGRVAMASLEPDQRSKVSAVMGNSPKPCARMMKLREAEEALKQTLLTPVN